MAFVDVIGDMGRYGLVEFGEELQLVSWSIES